MNVACNNTNFKCFIDLCYRGPRGEIIFWGEGGFAV